MLEHYSSHYDASIATVGETDIVERWHQPRKTLLKHKTCGSLLDLGCSSGGFLSSLESGPWTLHGIEMSASIAAKAQARTSADVFIGDILDAPYAPATFDAITCFHLLEHVHYPRNVLAKVHEWLKPGGVFIVYLPNIQSGGARLFRSYWYALDTPRHLYHFCPSTLRQLAGEVGLQEIVVRTNREPFIEASIRYIRDAMLEQFRISHIPLAEAQRPGMTWRLVRKALRLTVLPVLNLMVGLIGPGEVIQAVFSKR
jgi:SAM-dependent methyltransferase